MPQHDAWPVQDARTMRLAATPVSIGVARTQVAELCERGGLASLADTAALLVSELVTNAIMHGSGDITLSVHCDDSQVIVGVSDESTEPPLINKNPPTDRLGGRGLFLVDTLANSWDYQIAADGKTVWFCLEDKKSRVDSSAGEP
jgi:anti-sigma regulatory factor (Ser/Thr protein kinase)